MSSLSLTQVKALGFARDNHEGRPYRWPGGYWSDDPWHKGDAVGPPRSGRWVGTHTISALETRRLMAPVEGSRLIRGDSTVSEITSAGIAAHKTATKGQ